MKHMDGGQIDGQEITVSPILHMLANRDRPPIRQPYNRMGMRRSPLNRRRGGGFGGNQRRAWSPARNRSPIRDRRRSPLARVRRSPPPARKRRYERSSSSSSH